MVTLPLPPSPTAVLAPVGSVSQAIGSELEYRRNLMKVGMALVMIFLNLPNRRSLYV